MFALIIKKVKFLKNINDYSQKSKYAKNFLQIRQILQNHRFVFLLWLYLLILFLHNDNIPNGIGKQYKIKREKS